jgi:CheY-like chemotaxis protein
MSKRILVVEDQPDNRQIIRDMLDSGIQRPREPLRLYRR